MANTIAAFFTQIFNPSPGLEGKVEPPKETSLIEVDPVLKKILEDGFRYKQVWRAPVELYTRGRRDFILYNPIDKYEVIRFEDIYGKYIFRKRNRNNRSHAPQAPVM
jgi:hypothetical protein